MSEETKKSETAKREEAMLAFWNKEKIFEKSLKKPSPKGEFIFYDGPPFATGLPHHGHLLGSTSKDLFGRYRTMHGYYVRRRWGWDTHGLPIESKVEEKLGLKHKKEIFDIGVEKFNEAARSLVLEYVGEWRRYIERLGRWVDFDNSYKTMDASYTESVWWALKEIHKKGYLYEGYKVLMYCPHCETPLAKAEIAMDNTYKDVTDEAVTVKFRLLNPEKLGLNKPTFVLAWTTTPWTLPGNMALAVGGDIEYKIVDFNSEEYFIVAADEKLQLNLFKDIPGEEIKFLAETKKGSELAGLLYEPLYKIPKVEKHNGKRYQVATADFVTTENGTGIVHIAPMYGEDDFALGKKENLPNVQLLHSNGTYTDDAPEFIRGEYYKKGGKKVIVDLEARKLVFQKSPHTHSYPHCYRCGTALIYNAVSSWFINVQAVKQKMLAENEKINWVPPHLKEGRFKHIVESAPDWTISRNRFWASPLPIWKDTKGNVRVVGSLDELKSLTKKSGNQYFIMRHGQAESNIQSIVHSDKNLSIHLTEQGKSDAHTTAETLKDKKIDTILVSPFERTQETASIVAGVLGLSPKNILVDERLHEVLHGVYSGCPIVDYDSIYNTRVETFSDAPENGESFAEVKRRMGEFIDDIEQRYENKRILIISHGHPLSLLESAAYGHTLKETFDALHAPDYLAPANMRELPFTPLPHNADYELDYHLPYIDRVELQDENGAPLKRIPEVVDCWVESACMPFAEYHYPFENKNDFERRTPGDFVSEYIAQTRTWFYYMHAMGALIYNRLAFKNVVSTGTILASDGEKMSKSKGNFTDPFILINQYGSDALRYYLMSSVVMQSEDFNFRDEDLRDVHNKVVNILRNTLSFYELYKDEAPKASNTSTHVLDRWILTRLDEVVDSATKYFNAFDTVRATRPMRDFVEDFSTWYVRRSRERVKSDDVEDKNKSLATMRYVLCEFSKIIAPVMPFIADEMYRSVREEQEPESVHLTAWTETKGKSIWRLFGPSKSADSLIGEMQEVRELVSLALEARQKAGIKVRQPLKKLTVNSERLLGKYQLLELIKDELNVKEVVVQTGTTERIDLNIEITPELKEEGEVRELLREIQDLRKGAGLSTKDKAVLVFAGDTALLEKFWETVAKTANLSAFEKGEKTYVKT